MKSISISIPLMILTAGLCSCESFLAERHTSSVTNPASLQDLRAMMDGRSMILGYSSLTDAATDDFFVGKNGFDRLDDFQKSIYLWDSHYNYAVANENSHWSNPYHVIAISNTVLEELDLIKENKGLSRETIRGTALFYRAFAYLNQAQIYSGAYDPSTADGDPGLPLRLSADINLPSRRASMAETYHAMETDIRGAIDLLPETSEYRTRPNKVAAHALLARLLLIMERYEEALAAAGEALGKYGQLMDFNELNSALPFPIAAMNVETIFFAYSVGSSILHPGRECYVDTLLYQRYDEDDLRRTIYFKSENNGYHSFRGSYFGNGAGNSFIGLTVPELLLIQAEGYARAGRLRESLEALNRLLAHRYRDGDFSPKTAGDKDTLLRMVLEERRKELLFRGTRWADLKRLNRDPRFAKTLYRKVEGYDGTKELPPNDPRYVFLIPQVVIDMTDMPQNQR